MSCNCNNSYYNLPCCCPTGNIVTTTTTLCPDAIPCDESYSSDCIVYTEPDSTCFGNTITELIETLISNLPICNCRCITFTNLFLERSYVSWTPCIGDPTPGTDLMPNGEGATLKVCGYSPIVDPELVSYEIGDLCYFEDPIYVCETTTTTTSIP